MKILRYAPLALVSAFALSLGGCHPGTPASPDSSPPIVVGAANPAQVAAALGHMDDPANPGTDIPVEPVSIAHEMVGNPIANQVQPTRADVDEHSEQDFERTGPALRIAGWTGEVYDRMIEVMDDAMTHRDMIVVYKRLLAISDTYENYFASLATVPADVRQVIESVAEHEEDQRADPVVTFTDDADLSEVQDRFVVPDGPSSTRTNGMFYGIPGVFRCPAGDSTCTTEYDTGGDIVRFGGVWEFVATTAEDAGGEIDPGDAEDYLAFGFWLRETTDSEGEVTAAEFRSLASGLFGRGVRGLTGTARYVGSATGLYAKYEVGDDDARTGDPETGQFTANVTLTANFDSEMISGDVTDFKDREGGDIDQWAVTLAATSIDGTIDGGEEPQFSGVTSTTDTTVPGPDGTWSGRFYGDRSTPMEPPEAVLIDEFRAHFQNGDVRGAAGAFVQDPPDASP